jgi:lipoprotein-releasing system permease protein
MIIRTYEIMIAVRFLLKGRLQTILILAGIAVGVAVQFFLSALIGGLQISLIDKTVGTAAHILVQPADSFPREISEEKHAVTDSRKTVYSENSEILSWQQYNNYFKQNPAVTASCPVAGGQGFIEKGDVSYSVIIKGITFPDGALIYKFEKNIKSGRPELNGDNAIIGLTLAKKLNLQANDRFYVRSSKGTGNFFTVSGIIDLGSDQADNIVFLLLDRAKNFLLLNGISSIEIQIKNVFEAEKLAGKFRAEFSRIKIESWQERNKELLTALRSQSSSSDIIQFFVLFSISLGIASVLGIAAVQKSRQLGILKAMGVDDRGAAFIFLIQGLILGFLGALIGILLGYGMGVMFTKSAGNLSFGLEITAAKLISPVALAIFASALASLIPARSASKLSPIEVIRNG